MTQAEIRRFRRIENIFDEALNHAAGPVRDAWLRKACAGETGLYEEVASFLAERELLQPLVPPVEAMPRFGAWQASKVLGRGGMGTVYLADRADGAFRMTAAVKVAPLALASIEIEERFRRERQFLATFDHPKIARLIDGGMSEHGIPYLVMELVDGVAIDLFCAERDLDCRGCFQLMRQLMEALIYVHGRQVVHRDLQPWNGRVERDGCVKLLDFGTARLVDVGGDSITQSGVFAITPDYASPEQMAGQSVTFTSDVYSAGCLLRTLLGQKPLPRQFSLVLSKALESKPEDRYQSASEMDLDLGRCLDGSPVRANRRVLRKRLAAAVCAVLAIAVLAIIGTVAVLRQSPARRDERSVAVLPFESLSADRADRYFADGVTAEVIDSLSRLRTVRVVALSSAAQAAGQTRDSQKAGRLLKVSHVINGSVARLGDRIRIVAYIERVSDGSVVWSETWERRTADLFTVQTELAAAVASNLKLGAGTAAAAYIPNATAHELVIRARYELQRLTPGSLNNATNEYQKAIEIDPRYAAAYLGLATTIFDQASMRGTVETENERRTEEDLLRKALKLDPNLPTAHAWLAFLAMQFGWDWTGAERELKTAVSGPSSSTAESNYAFFLTFRGRFSEADEHITRLLDLDPYSTATLNNVAVIRGLEGRFEEARAVARQLAAQNPESIQPWRIIGGTYIEQGRPDLALEAWGKVRPRVPQLPVFEAMAEAKAGRREKAIELIRPFENNSSAGASPMWLGFVYAFLGDEANVLKWLNRLADSHDWAALSIGIHPVFAPMRNSAGFIALKRRMGFD